MSIFHRSQQPLLASAPLPQDHWGSATMWKHESGVAALFHSSDLSQTTQVWQLSHSSSFFRPTPSWLPPGRLTRSIVCYKLDRMVNWCKNGRLLIEWRQEWTGKGLVYSPVGRHKNATRKQKRANTKHTKNKQKTTQTKHKKQQQRTKPKQAWQVPVHELITQEVITLYHLNLVWQKKQKEEPTKTSPGHTRRWAKQQKYHAETRDPPSQDPRDHMAPADKA